MCSVLNWVPFLVGKEVYIISCFKLACYENFRARVQKLAAGKDS